MTPKEKANDLLSKMWMASSTIQDARECALIAVDEIINANPHSNPFNTYVSSTMAYWQQVKHEINNL